MSNDKKKNRANNFKIPIKKPTRKEFVTTLAGERYLEKADEINEEIRQFNIANSRAISRACEERYL